MEGYPEQVAIAAFERRFGGAPTIVAQAPGRVELLGNHTDYNGGLVLAAAIDRHTVAVGRPNDTDAARVHAVHFNADDIFPIHQIEPSPPGSWGRYVRGVAWVLSLTSGPLRGGFDLVLAGDMPVGAGLSSSASLQAAVGLFLIAANLVPLDEALIDLRSSDPARRDASRMELAHRLRRSENEFVGVGSGLLDQFTVLFGEPDRALTLDCRTLEHEVLPLGPPTPAIVVCDSKTSRRLADGMYDARRAECERAVTELRALGLIPPEATLLRDVPEAALEAGWDRIDPVARRRARHVLSENARVRAGADALRRGDVPAFARLMSASHASSRDDFENSSEALDALIDVAEAAPGFLGGKLSGAGWAGCTVNLVQADQADAFAAAVRDGYRRRMGLEPGITIGHAAAGATAGGLDAGTSH